MKRNLVSAALLVGALGAAAPEPATSQLSAAVHLSWQWGDGRWQPAPVVDGYLAWRDAPARRPRSAPARVIVAPARLHVPPGHLPPPGMCRLWEIGRPPGHQAPPTSCARAFRMRPVPGTVILHTPGRGGGGWWGDDPRDDGRDDDDRWEDDSRWDRHEKGPKRGGGKSGRGRGRRN